MELRLKKDVATGKDLYPLNKTITEAYERCDYLALEANPSDFKSEEVVEAMAEFMKYSDGTKISDILGEDLYERVMEELKKEYPQLSETTMETYRPVFFFNMLQMITMDKTELSDEYGIDLYFYNRAMKENKEVLGIEPLDKQWEIFAGYTNNVNMFLLEEALNTEENAREMTVQYAAWRIGDAEAIIETELLGESVLQSDFSQEEWFVYQEMGVNRSLYMADVAEQYLKEQKSVFFIVGLAHMLGKHGIVNQLREKGYTVEPVSYGDE
ncbi:TraB/GumN family protein [Christensenellaceae bacterium OttesenSCG-928-L17]|nr:TraB/GumN family protein [Christensenellaceae bacterium OttesenSCG-928-L17]